MNVEGKWLIGLCCRTCGLVAEKACDESDRDEVRAARDSLVVKHAFEHAVLHGGSAIEPYELSPRPPEVRSS